MRRFHFVLSALVLLVAQPLLAKTYYVGSCKTGAYSTISAAVAAVPADSIIDVCPGTYPEQVVISQPLTLQGIASGGSAQAVIAMPSSGLTTTTSLRFGTVAAQVEVTSGPVNITGITVVGPGSGCTVEVVGIFYASGSSGTLNAVQTQFQYCGIPGIGILAENGSGVSTSVTIENSNTNLSGYAGIYVCSPTPSTLNANIKNNYVIENIGYGIATDCNTTATVSDNVVDANYGKEGIILMAPSSKVTGNTLTGGTGILSVAPGAVISGNTITLVGAGIWLDGAATVTSNRISNGTFGIVIAVPGSTIQTNFMSQVEIGIEFQCETAAASGNTIGGPGDNGPGTGFDQFPGTSTGTNKFHNVATIATGCS